MSDWATTLDELVRARGDALIAAAYLLTGDLGEAEDLVQDSLVAAYSRRRTDDDIRSAEAYVRRTIRNTFVDGFRRRKRWAAVRHLTVAPAHQPDDGSTTPEHVPAHLDVLRALSTLAPRERTCVVLRFYDDMTVPQIAAELGLAQGSVKRYLADAVARLEHQLGPLADAHHIDLDVTHGGAR
ncbi:SigE family RNA polymerase sigma factor [Sanguibacter sp. A247]|uniref:SigE family RNA polymerase sigma factor n=1 Tax=unclassified Sanguibacter TaxID=2645534 RepID=UPI003FD7CADA